MVVTNTDMKSGGGVGWGDMFLNGEARDVHKLDIHFGILRAKRQVTADLKMASSVICRMFSVNSQCQLTYPIQAIRRGIPVSS